MSKLDNDPVLAITLDLRGARNAAVRGDESWIATPVPVQAIVERSQTKLRQPCTIVGISADFSRIGLDFHDEKGVLRNRIVSRADFESWNGPLNILTEENAPKHAAATGVTASVRERIGKLKFW